MNIENFIYGEIALACMNQEELDQLMMICEEHELLQGSGERPIEGCERMKFEGFPVTMYHDGDVPSLNYMAGDDWEMDWGLPIVKFADINLQTINVVDFLELI